MVDRGRLDYCKDLGFVDPRIRSSAPNEKMELLSIDYIPGPWDVICQGGKDSFDHIGNRRFRVCIENNLNTYTKAKTKHERSMVVTSIVDAVRDSCTQLRGGFVRKDQSTNRWYEVGDKIAREKVGHALRDAIKLRQSENTGSKKSQPGIVPLSSPGRGTKRRRNDSMDSSSCTSKPHVPLAPEGAHSTNLPSNAQYLKSLPRQKVKSAVPVPDLPCYSMKKNKTIGCSTSADSIFVSGLNSENNEVSDDASSSGDSVLTQLALQTSVDKTTGTSEECVELYQKSLRLMATEDQDDSHSNADPVTVPDEPTSTTKRPIEWKPPGYAHAEELFCRYTKLHGLCPAQVINSQNDLIKPPITTGNNIAQTDSENINYFGSPLHMIEESNDLSEETIRGHDWLKATAPSVMESEYERFWNKRQHPEGCDLSTSDFENGIGTKSKVFSSVKCIY